MAKVIFEKLSKDQAKTLFDRVINKTCKNNGTYCYEKYHIRISGTLRIEDYNKYMREYHKTNRHKYNKLGREIYRQRKRSGLCTKCGKLNTSPNDVKCIECRGEFFKS